ncbi:MAG: hypothetical protein CMJ40_11545 [Phycisphaerae bacterium]|nr:hypothetical protein [Phycisphaerae bacterium]
MVDHGMGVPQRQYRGRPMRSCSGGAMIRMGFTVLALTIASIAPGAVQPSSAPAAELIRDLGPHAAPRIRFVDTPLIARELQLDDERQVILDQIVLDYLTFVERETRALAERLAAADPYEVSTDPAAIRRDELRGAVRDALSRSSESDDAAKALRESMLEELAVTDPPGPIASPRTRELASWDTAHDQQWTALVGGIDAIRDRSEPGHWDAVFRALRRRNTPWRPVLPGEGVDLARIVYDHWGRDSDVARACHGVLLDYAKLYDEMLAGRDWTIARIRPLQRDARIMGTPGPWIDGARREASARGRLAEVNDRYLEVIRTCMNDGDAERFRSLADRAMYPEVFRPTAFHRLLRHVQRHSQDLGLTPEELRTLDELNEDYEQSLGPLRAEWLEVARRAESEAILLAAESEAMLRCYGFMGPVLPGREEIVGRPAVLREGIGQLDESATALVFGLLGADRFGRIPPSAYQPELIAGPGSSTAESPGAFRVVYLRGAGDRTGLGDRD